MSQYICSSCGGEFHSAEDHHCYKLKTIVDAPARAEENLLIAWESWEMAHRFPTKQ